MVGESENGSPRRCGSWAAARSTSTSSRPARAWHPAPYLGSPTVSERAGPEGTECPARSLDRAGMVVREGCDTSCQPASVQSAADGGAAMRPVRMRPLPWNGRSPAFRWTFCSEVYRRGTLEGRCSRFVADGPTVEMSSAAGRCVSSPDPPKDRDDPGFTGPGAP